MPITIESTKIAPNHFSNYVRLPQPHIIVEGPDFSGKSSLCKAFGAAGISIDSELREPNDAVRKMLRSGEFAQLSLREQAAKMEWSRAQIAYNLREKYSGGPGFQRHEMSADTRYVHIQDRGFPSTYVSQLRPELEEMYAYPAAGFTDSRTTYLRMFFDRQMRIGLAPTAVLVLLPEVDLLTDRVTASKRAVVASETAGGTEEFHPGMDEHDRVLDARAGYVDFCEDFNADTIGAVVRLVTVRYSYKLLDNPTDPTPKDKRLLWELVGRCTG